MSNFDEEHRKAQEARIAKGRDMVALADQMIALSDQYQKLSPRELKDLLQEKHNNDTLTPTDMKVVESLYPNPEDDWLPLIGKSLLEGALSITDIPKLLELPHNLKYGEDNPSTVKAKDTLKKLDPYTYDFDQKSLLDFLKEKVEPKPDTPAKRIAANAGEWVGASLVPFGAPAKAAKSANLLDKFKVAKDASIFDKFFKHPVVKSGIKGAVKAGGAGIIGGTSGMLQEQDVDPLTADLIAGIGLPSAKNLSKGVLKVADILAAKTAGLGKKSIDLPVALAARNLGVDLPASALTDNYLTTVADHSGSKSFLTAKFHKAKKDELNTRMEGIIDGIIKRTGMPNNSESRQIVHNLYEEANASLPKDAALYPSLTHKATKKVLEDLAESLFNSDNEKKVIKAAKKIQDQVAPYNMKGVKTPIKRLTATKVSLNDLIDWKAPSDVKSRIKALQGGIKDDLRLYGESNPVWYEKLLAADKAHGGIKKRLELEDIIDDSMNHANGEYSSYRLAKNLNEPTNNKLIKRLVGEQDVSKVDDLASVTKSIHKQKERNPNKSGTSTTTKALELLKRPLELIHSAMPVGVAYTTLIDNPNFINRAVDRAAGLNKNASNIFRDTALDIDKQLPIVASREASRQRKREPMTKEQIDRRLEEIYNRN